MYVINKNLLNELEKNIHSILLKEIKEKNTLSITEAATTCSCSPSKISKFVQKLGFKSYKEYSTLISGKSFSVIPDESERLKKFLDHFNPEVVDHFINYFQKFDKIILFGYGSSFIVGQYFEYKLRSILDIPVWAVPNEASINNLLKKNNLVIIFSVTGKCKSFKTLYENIISKNGKAVFLLEEGSADCMEIYDFVIILTNYLQNPNLLPHEKTRTTFFTFIEEVIKKLESHS
ncbi:DNA-binding MurR/RpiR family transcriptional regulator [Chryseobacterium ginsenosidimutans]|uniref:MurR/RpiR family transcriptional regulator n=1 Tax=Chryseobacterium ginsenosidimutans TaxID=687846 RepID=UPI00216A0A56|nr:SIS domain-containing protein [Chryseobacterium ginsenosidimutans]MCS3869230.1 DNA-binding MurR/RpiR family transcriptional regulator [Chryseobacterium ginsenosidimutans]